MEKEHVQICPSLYNVHRYLIDQVDAITLSGIVFGKQKLGVNFNFDKQDVIDSKKKKIKTDHVQIHKSSHRSIVF